MDCISWSSANPESDSSPGSFSFFFLVLQGRWWMHAKKIKNGVCGCRAQSTIYSSCRRPITGSHGFPEAACMSLIRWCSNVPALRLFQNVFFRQWLVVLSPNAFHACLSVTKFCINPIIHAVICAKSASARSQRQDLQ